mmetsp:Transcript_4659/g.14554  ORF Transcript_4659/g.14554 Transcript_4659/m.14554 type:complete len:179 (-) Transcript_4659:894-1430(-)
MHRTRGRSGDFRQRTGEALAFAETAAKTASRSPRTLASAAYWRAWPFCARAAKTTSLSRLKLSSANCQPPRRRLPRARNSRKHDATVAPETRVGVSLEGRQDDLLVALKARVGARACEWAVLDGGKNVVAVSLEALVGVLERQGALRDGRQDHGAVSEEASSHSRRRLRPTTPSLSSA